MAGVVEKMNPRKPGALSIKRDTQRGNQRGRTIEINELTLSEVKEDAIRFALATNRRDISNVLNYIERSGISRDPDCMVRVFLSEYVPDNLRNYSEGVASISEEGEIDE